MKRYIRVLAALMLLAAPAPADEFTIAPQFNGDRSEFNYYPGGESGAQWKSVDESGVHDGFTTYIYAIEGLLIQGFRSLDTDIPPSLPGTIDTVRVLIVAVNRTGTMNMYAFTDTLGANTENFSTGLPFGTFFDSGWYAWTLCPWTGVAWTRQNLIDLEFGVRVGNPGIGDTAYVTQCNVSVVWTPGVTHGARRRRTHANASPPSDSKARDDSLTRLQGAFAHAH